MLCINNLGEGGWNGVGKSVGESASGVDCGVGIGAFGNRQSWDKNSTVLTTRSYQDFGMYTQ